VPATLARARFAAARVGRLGTVGPKGEAHLVPCCFAVEGEHAYSAVDDKPKRHRRLQRLDDVARRGTATLLVDHYDEDWTVLWWVRVSGAAHLVDDPEVRGRAVRLLRDKYPQYAAHALDGPVVALRLEHWQAWSADGRV